MLVARHRTALSRHKLSRPVQLAIEDGLINQTTRVFDYGCGKGDDVRNLIEHGIACSGWDPVYYPDGKPAAADVVNLGYVINVIENATERAAVLQKAWALASKLLIVSARLSVEAKDINCAAYEDGYLTRLATFQKFYEQHELRDWIDNTLGASSLPSAPGIFYIFRDDELKQSFAASRYRRISAVPRQRRSDVIFEQHKAILEPLIAFVALRGRLPVESELQESEVIRKEIGSLQRAFSIVRKVTGSEQWDKIREERAQDLLIYIALSRFTRRPQFSYLPADLQLDIRAFFSNYRHACDQADELLFSAGQNEKIDAACRAANVGKLTPNALYVHTSALQNLPAVLRIYEGCARSYIGSVEGANIIKLHRRFPQVSYLSYPDFDKDPHPTLVASLIVPLQTVRVQFRDYRNSKNPFILHRKEEFISSDHPLHQKFARLTRQEEKRNLYDNPELIGTRDGWQETLNACGVRLSGHRVVSKREVDR
jgi:DNA phosphorothioation-associated putative methyltransferase